MARIVGIDLPREKRVEAGLQSIYDSADDIRAFCPDLTDEEVNLLSSTIQATVKVEGDLRREISANIKRLMEINCYRGQRHKKGLPVRGQRTSTNARTRKGPRKMAVKKK